MTIALTKPIAIPDPDAEALEAAFRHHQDGRIDEAIAQYRAVVARTPDHPNALLLLAMLLADRKEVEEAERLLRRRLGLSLNAALSPDTLHPALAEVEGTGADLPARRVSLAMVVFELGTLRQRKGDDAAAVLLYETATILKPDYAPAYNNISLSLHRIGRRDLALSMVDKALAIDPAFRVALRNRGHILLELRRPDEAAASFETWTGLDPESVEAWTNLGIAALAIPDTARADVALRRALALDPAHVEAHVQLANTLDHDHRHEEAARYRSEAARRHGIVTSPCIGRKPQARILVVGGAGLCNLNLQFLIDRRHFESVVAYLQPPGQPDAVAETTPDQLPRCDVVINAVADVDKGADFLAKAGAFAQQFGLPIINPPDHRIARTTRDGVAALMADVPELTVPSMRRVSRDELGAMPVSDALLVRPAGAHGGDDLVRVERAEEIAAFLERIPSREFYVSRFHDFASLDGYYRKYRLVFVDREVFPYHLTIGKDWKLHYYRVDMNEKPWMKPEEEAFLENWRSAFPGGLGDAVGEVARRLDLDFAGMDCAIHGGKVLLFEANPTMLVHLTESRAEYPYKHRHVPRIFDAFGRMLVRRLEAAATEALLHPPARNHAA